MGKTREERLEAALERAIDALCESDFKEHWDLAEEIESLLSDPSEPQADVQSWSDSKALDRDAAPDSEPEGNAEALLAELAHAAWKGGMDSQGVNQTAGGLRRALRQLKGYAETIRIVRRELGLPDDSPDGGNDLRCALRQRVPEAVRRRLESIIDLERVTRQGGAELEDLRDLEWAVKMAVRHAGDAKDKLDRAIAQEKSDG